MLHTATHCNKRVVDGAVSCVAVCCRGALKLMGGYGPQVLLNGV